MKYIALIILWIIWCSIHSGMITLTFSSYIKNRFNRYYRFYRLFFNLVALATLIPLILYSISLKGPVLFQWQGYMIVVQLFLLAIAMVLFVEGGLKYDMLQFFGIRQIISGETHLALSKGGEIDTSGILSLTRHPWYLGAIIFIWVDYREMYASTLIVNIILTFYLVVGTLLEERKLIIEFGDRYRDYRRKVSMLFPFTWLSERLLKNKRDNILCV
jgi:methanethiol S-methyltransferase